MSNYYESKYYDDEKIEIGMSNLSRSNPGFHHTGEYRPRNVQQMSPQTDPAVVKRCINKLKSYSIIAMILSFMTIVSGATTLGVAAKNIGFPVFNFGPLLVGIIVFYVLLVAAFLIHENSAHPHGSAARRRRPLGPLLPLQPPPSTSNPAVQRQLASCRSLGHIPCFGGRTVRCYPPGESCNGARYCQYGDDELNCHNSGSTPAVRTFTVRITRTNSGGQINTVVSTTTTTTTSTMTSASTTSTLTSTERSTSTTSVTPTAYTPHSIATTSTSSVITRLVTRLTPVVGLLPGPGTICIDYVSLGAAATVATTVVVLTSTNVLFSDSIEAVAQCTSTVVQA